MDDQCAIQFRILVQIMTKACHFVRRYFLWVNISEALAHDFIHLATVIARELPNKFKSLELVPARMRAPLAIIVTGATLVACSPEESKQSNAIVKLNLPAGFLTVEPPTSSSATELEPQTCAQRCAVFGVEAPTCTKRCTAYEAGYQWAKRKRITNTARCVDDADSFVQGCLAYTIESNTDAEKVTPEPKPR